MTFDGRGVMTERLRVLFICTGNSARSQMAEALLRKLSHGQAEVFSAGSDPRPEIHPLARGAVRDLFGLEMADQHLKPFDSLLGERFDYVISVCDHAAEACPVFPGAPERIRWSFEDPARVEGTEAEKRRAFERTAKDLMGRIRIWMALPSVASRIGSATVGHTV
jgi:protein-tyrosine-phosphatase